VAFSTSRTGLRMGATRPAAPAAEAERAAADVALDEAIHAARQGDEHAFRLVYRAVQPGLLRYLTVLVGEADAEDVCSEAWVQIARDLDSFHGDADGFRGWTATIGRNRALDHLRQLRRRPSSALTLDELPERTAPDDTADSALDALGTSAALRLLAELPQDQAEAVLLRVVIGLDAPGAARVLGKRPGAVRTAAHRGLKKLAERIGNSEPPGLAETPRRRRGGSVPHGSAAPVPPHPRTPDDPPPAPAGDLHTSRSTPSELGKQKTSGRE
jgi:RNA polymerase sigma-70 factor (ECF subfamily)